MTPYYKDDWLTVWQGDCREVMATMEPESVHCVVTSPPYWGLRDYGTAAWLGGDEGCDHKDAPTHRNIGFNERWGRPTGELQQEQSQERNFRHTCRKCGAVRQDSQLGLEPTPDEYVANMVAVFREVRRVLRADGTVWLNLGDSYNAGTSSARNNHFTPNPDDTRAAHFASRSSDKARMDVDGLKPKDLVGIPWRVAFALQADGWYLRSDIIWSKPNPMPESVTDRPTKAHEYLFLLSKSPRYYYDADAVREPLTSYDADGLRLDGKPTRSYVGHHGAPTYSTAGEGARALPVNPAGRNLRSVWSIATQPYPGAHFATFPEALVEPCVKAGTSERGVCPECGAPWVRQVEVRPEYREWAKTQRFYGEGGNGSAFREAKTNSAVAPQKSDTVGWRRSCAHDAVPVPATVLDPFAGSGTTGRVAQRLGRRAVLIDLSGEYLTQAMRRNQDIPLGLESA